MISTWASSATSEENARYRSVYDRMNALGLEYLGSSSGDAIVPIFRRPSLTAAEADTQLDHVFVSREFHQKATVSAMNSVDEWGPATIAGLSSRYDTQEPAQRDAAHRTTSCSHQKPCSPMGIPSQDITLS